MKKSFSILAASMMMCSVVFASPMLNEPSCTILNAMEHAALFGEGTAVQVVALDSAEMKTTEGEFLPYLAWSLGVTYATYANAPSNTNAVVYTKWPYQNTYIGVQYTTRTSSTKTSGSVTSGTSTSVPTR